MSSVQPLAALVPRYPLSAIRFPFSVFRFPMCGFPVPPGADSAARAPKTASKADSAVRDPGGGFGTPRSIDGSTGWHEGTARAIILQPRTGRGLECDHRTCAEFGYSADWVLNCWVDSSISQQRFGLKEVR